jgi:polyhydroxyalkanoate synthesis regulator phasin
VERHIVPGLNSFNNARREMERYVNKLIKRGRLEPEEGKRMISELFASGQRGLEEAYSRIDGRVTELLDSLKALATLSREVARLEERLDELEARLNSQTTDFHFFLTRLPNGPEDGRRDAGR